MQLSVCTTSTPRDVRVSLRRLREIHIRQKLGDSAVGVLLMPRGNTMLVGVGGSGRQSLTRLSSYIASIGVFTIEITKQYRMAEWREDIKRLFEQTGILNKPTTFLFNDTQLKEQGFLEDINNILNSGEIPNLYGKDEIPAIYDGVRKRAIDAGSEGTSPVALAIRLLQQHFYPMLAHLTHCIAPVSSSHHRSSFCR